MAKIIPQAQDLGPRPSLRTNRPVVVDRSGEIEAQGLVGLSKTVSAIADGMLAREDKLTYAKARSDFLANDIDIRRDVYESDDFENWENNYVERITKELDTAAKGIKSNYDRALFQQEARLHIKTESLRLDVEKAKREAIHGRATLDELLETNRSKALSMDDTFDRQPVIDNTLDAIRAAQSKRYIDKEDATSIWQSWQESYAEGFAELLDPAKRIEQLSNPSGTVLEFLQPDRRKILLEQAKRDLADDPETRRRETQLKIERALAIADFKRTVSAFTTDEEIALFAEQLKITDHGLISSFFNERQKKIEANNLFQSEFIDPTDKKVRDAVDIRVNELTDDPGDKVEILINVAADSGIASSNLERYFEAGGRSEKTFAEATQRYQRFREQAPNAYLPLSDDAKSLYSQSAVLARAGMDPISAANTAWEIVHTSTPEQIQDRATNYPADEIVGDVIADLNDIPGMHKPGLFIDATAEVPAEMAGDMNRIGLAVFKRTGDVDAARQAVADNIPNAWGYTDVNKGIQSGDAEFDDQYMKLAPKRSTELVRKVLAEDIGERIFLLGNQLQTIDLDRVELWQPPLPEVNSFGQPVWTLRVDGVPLLDELGQVVRWTYQKPPGSEKPLKPQFTEAGYRILPGGVSGTIERN